MVTQVLLTQKAVAAIQFAILGKNTYTTASTYDAVAGQFRTGAISQEQYISNLLASTAGQTLYSGKTDLEIVKLVYASIWGSIPADSVAQAFLTGSNLNAALNNVINGVLNYTGFDSATLTAQTSFDNALNKVMYKDYGSANWNTWSVALSSKEQVEAAYISLVGRSVDMGGLGDWTNYLTTGGNTYSSLLTKLIASSEFQSKGASLTGDAFISHVYQGIYGVAPSASVLAQYSALGTNKATITQAIINDLRSSTATDAATVTNQHAFEYQIGTGLLYKTSAVLSASAAGGNATGTVNTNASHQLTNAETAVLTNAQLNANVASTVNLKFADHLANLTINGSSAATVNLSDNGVNPGVDIVVNNGSVILNASSGADDVVVSNLVNMTTATAKFNLGTGNDTLKWAGNSTGGANTVSTSVTADGGAGIDTISANFITKNVAMGGNIVTRTAVITSNSSQFSNFEKLDLAGYIGQATVSAGSTAQAHTFDFGVLTGNATTESSLTGTLGTTITQAGTSTVGSQGFVLSGLANNVHVINAAGGNSAQLEVTGNATAASSVDITFRQNITDHFNVNFTATSNSDINAGSLALNSSNSLLGTALTTLNIGSGGTGNFANSISLAGTSSQVQTINVTGDHLLNLTVGTGYGNLETINASANTAGLNLDANVGGTGKGILYQLLTILPGSAVTTTLITLLGLDGGHNLSVQGTGAADTFKVLGNTVVSGGNGANLYQLKASTVNSGVTISDFNSGKDSIFDTTSGLTINNDATHTQVADYGVRTTDVVDALLGTLVGGVVGGVVGLLGQILGIGGTGDLTSKVGVASVVWTDNSHEASNYLIIDNNNDHTLDANDTVVYLNGQTHQQLVDTLHYA
ncbi:beta strand repeat-containing protein [Klebsiella aerogenes]|uniref:beta strand repeat-containing protein n=1 Tax=Klebsiella aerogenes TaxID=548 RepID=UPI003A8E07F0